MVIRAVRSLLAVGMVTTLLAAAAPNDYLQAQSAALTSRSTAGDGLNVIELRVSARRLNRPLKTSGFSMVGLTWRGESPPIRVRARSGDRWRAWRTPDLLTDGPDKRSGEGAGRSATVLLWVGPSDAVQVDVRGQSPRDLRLTLMEEDDSASSQRAAAAAASEPVARSESARKKAPSNAPRPQLRGRRLWGADPRLKDEL